MPTQTEAGKAFEYALLMSIYGHLNKTCKIEIIEDSSFNIAKICFKKFKSFEHSKYNFASNAATQHIIDLEPRLNNLLTPKDVLELQIVPDSQGIQGDVRDILAIRKGQNWEIGISAKNHHRAVKHSRLSDKIDFGKKWIDVPCSQAYFKSIKPLFNKLREFKNNGELWKNLSNKETNYYFPILNAFKNELLKIEKNNKTLIPQKLVQYLIGSKDFYKIIKESSSTTIQAFNFKGTLNKPANQIKPKHIVPKLNFPKRIIELEFKNSSKNTLILTCDGGWQVSFRIHNASSKVEPSLKFDINLIGHPPNLYTNHISWNYE